ncbi:MAG: hypothetical protein H3C47_08560 [Candidatus Cloacimonetes bacterium]|nr:hypothetical protein [Candidatus Cloacimonadota bacterium]
MSYNFGVVNLQMRYSIVLISQPGLVPWFIKSITRSKWNHIGLIDDSGKIYDLDWGGPGVYRMENRSAWGFHILPITIVHPQVEVLYVSYRYSLWKNLNWLFQRLGISYRIFNPNPFRQNCVGFVAAIFGQPEWVAFAPGDFETLQCQEP